MPELPEVEIVKRALEPSIREKYVEKLVFNRPNLRFPLPQNLPQKLEGQRLQKIERRGKYIVVFAQNGTGFVLHLGMSGVIRIEKDPSAFCTQKHDHVELYLKDGPRIVLNDARRFGFLEALEEKRWHDYEAFRFMGSEPLGNDFNGPVLAESLKGRSTLIKTALLDQKIVAGIGNIYACEALYRACIDPRRAAGDLSLDECEMLAQAIKKVLVLAIEAGGSSLKDYKHTDGKLGYFQHHFTVYGREGESCPMCKCDDTLKSRCIQKITQAGRSTFFCPKKQV